MKPLKVKVNKMILKQKMKKMNQKWMKMLIYHLETMKMNR